MTRAGNPAGTTHIARWDLDKTYLRTEFDTLRDLVKTALERADEKRSHPGAAALLRELQSAGVEVHVLSGSPEQMRRRLTAKLQLDGIRFASLTLKPNLQNLVRLRFRSIRGQLGYKLPALLQMRVSVDSAVHETLVGDDAEADAFIYALYADVCTGKVDVHLMEAIMIRDRCHPEEIEDAMRAASLIEASGAPSAAVVDRILIHLDQQTPPGDFVHYGERLAPFYNYFQAALVLHEDRRITAEAVLRVGTDLVLQHRFDGDALVRSYLDLAKRGHVRGSGIDELVAALERWPRSDSGRASLGLDEVHALARREADLRRSIK
ncbi:MAG: phosphatase domain-containing protein, partial [Polyangiales bacterium]